MAKITIGTTPTITYVDLDICTPADITSAILTVTQVGANGASSIVIEKDDSEMERGDDYIRFTFTQEETLRLKPTLDDHGKRKRTDAEKPVILTNYMAGTTRAVTHELVVDVQDNPIRRVME